MRAVLLTLVLLLITGCITGNPTAADPQVTTYPQLDVRVYPEGSAYVLLNPVPLDGGLFPSGMIVTIEVLPGPGWEIDKNGWKGPVFDIAGDTAKIKMISTQEIVIKMRPAVRPQAGRPAPKPQASGATSINRETVTVIKEDDGVLEWHVDRGTDATPDTSYLVGVSETGSTSEFGIVLKYQPESEEVISIVSGDTGEVTVSPDTLTFTSSNWNSMQAVTLTGVDDTDDDGNQYTTITVSGVGDNWASDETLFVVTEDDEDDGLLDWHLERYGETFKFLEVSETGSTYPFEMWLWSQPSSDAVLSITSGDTGEVAVSPGTLTFTNSNWDSAQTVTLTGVDDTDRDGNQTTIVKVSGVGDGWNSRRGEALYVVTTDDDVTLKPSRLLGQGTGNTPTGTPPPTVSICLSIESYSGTIDDSGTFVQTIGQLPIRRGETISVSGTYYYDGTWKVLQYFRYNDLSGYRIEKKWQGFPDDKDPMVCTLP